MIIASELLPDFKTFNGWTNYETWNVALWISNHSDLNDIAKGSKNYREFVRNFGFESETGDEVSFTDDNLNIKELDELIAEIV